MRDIKKILLDKRELSSCHVYSSDIFLKFSRESYLQNALFLEQAYS